MTTGPWTMGPQMHSLFPWPLSIVEECVCVCVCNVKTRHTKMEMFSTLAELYMYVYKESKIKNVQNDQPKMKLRCASSKQAS